MVPQKVPEGPQILQGRIVYALDAIPDPQGWNPKPNRPFVVISSRDEIATHDAVRVVAISRNVFGEPFEVLLPFGPYALTRLTEKSAAICTWVTLIRKDRLEVRKGFVPPAVVEQVLIKVAEFAGKQT